MESTNDAPMDGQSTNYPPDNAPMDGQRTNNPPDNAQMDGQSTNNPPDNAQMDGQRTNNPPDNAQMDGQSTNNPPDNAQMDGQSTNNPPDNAQIDDQIEPITDQKKKKSNEDSEGKRSGKSKKDDKTTGTSSTSSSNQPKKELQILDSVKIKSSGKFATSLKKKLKDCDCKIMSTDEVQPDIPLAVVCVNSTRLKPDVKLALENLHYTEEFVVIIVHTVAKSNLPVIPSSEKLDGYQENIKFIDMGFYNEKIYTCHCNDEACNKLIDYIKEFHKFKDNAGSQV